jgi:phosphomannomutase
MDAADDAGTLAADREAITFGTDGWRATLDEFTDGRVRMVGQAVATHLDREDAGDSVAVGYDARGTSRGFAEELCRVLAANGFDIVLSERDCPTPVLAWSVVDRGFAGGLMVTASHNPPEYNGVKFLPGDGAPALPAVTDRLEAELARPEPRPEGEWGAVREADLTAAYRDHALRFAGVERDGDALAGMTVAYDAMHGSGRGVTDDLLAVAGAELSRLRCSRDPEFGGTPPEPVPRHLERLTERVTDGDADIGIANDGDADRLAVVTPGRGCLDANRLFAVLYDHLLEDDAGPAVRTVSTSFLIDRVAGAHGRSVHETPVGFKWVAQAMADHGALMGGEESAGFGVTDHLRNKDGVLLALLVARAHADRALDDRLDALLAEHGDIVQDRVSVDCPDDRKAAVLRDLEDVIPDAVAGTLVEEVVTVDGFKLLLADGSWLLVRPSGTEPKLRIYAEAGSESAAGTLLAEGRELVEPLV